MEWELRTRAIDVTLNLCYTVPVGGTVIRIPIDIIRDFNHGWIGVKSSRTISHVLSLYGYQNTCGQPTQRAV